MARGHQVVCGSLLCGPVATRMFDINSRNILERCGTVRPTLDPPRRHKKKVPENVTEFTESRILSANKLEVIIFK